ncbi:RTX toxin [Xenorhabdus mauleonii]|uniref:RTX toxin n=1 Tax=Xenorhabdus mauleonii TaxID=351675 RepID=A0A1I3L5D7_9GAMM|nr:hypothetical protein [Xenorhabdus mauleonii]PHM44553.1 RTX toxin [Xenorhabdus mauleonii]SFI79888.1 hypothetical protein SAMN05421680_103299 [Xenorhabdus mauleonii]
MSPGTKAEQEIMRGTPVSAVVYIWYQCSRYPVGHTAIYIDGVPQCPWQIGVPQDSTQPLHAAPRLQPPNAPLPRRKAFSPASSNPEQNLPMNPAVSGNNRPPSPYNVSPYHVTEQNAPSTSSQNRSDLARGIQSKNYISFYSTASNVLQGISYATGTLVDIKDDFEILPHLEYYLIDLDIERMKAKRNEIYNGNTRTLLTYHRYHFINKNCATMVARVLKAGGVESLLNRIQRIGYAKNLYWTPHDIAQLCDELRANDKAVKIRGLNCPDKLKSPLRALFGFR